MHAQRSSQALIIVDGHVDLPHRLRTGIEHGHVTEDVSGHTEGGHFDYPRALSGGLDAAFMSIYVPVSYQARGARALADGLIDLVESLARNHPAQFALARSPEEVRQNARSGKISLPLGIENGAALERDLHNVRHFRERGVSYITLTHTRDNALGDSSALPVHTHHGLSAFGRRVIREMNRVGIMVDVSHVSDDTFYQAVKLSQVPVIASHSALRHFVPGLERNVSDDMLRALAGRGGVILINFDSGFLLPQANAVETARWQAAATFARDHGLNKDVRRDREQIDRAVNAALPLPRASVTDVADQIDRVRSLVGIDHVGFGSDFDGVGDSMPSGLEDVSAYPNLLRALIERGYSDAELEQICSGNLLRVWQMALDHASAAHGSTSPQ